jgi:PAS domain-containing protein
LDVAATEVDGTGSGPPDLTVRMVRMVRMVRNGVAVIASVDEFVVDLLGWRPEEWVGVSSTKFIHPDDRAGAVAAWVRMLESADGAGVWRGRYQSAHGTWVWVARRRRRRLDDRGARRRYLDRVGGQRHVRLQTPRPADGAPLYGQP